MEEVKLDMGIITIENKLTKREIAGEFAISGSQKDLEFIANQILNKIYIRHLDHITVPIMLDNQKSDDKHHLKWEDK